MMLEGLGSAHRLQHGQAAEAAAASLIAFGDGLLAPKVGGWEVTGGTAGRSSPGRDHPSPRKRLFHKTMVAWEKERAPCYPSTAVSGLNHLTTGQ